MPDTPATPLAATAAPPPPTAPQRVSAWLQVVQLAVTIATGSMAFLWSQQTEKLKLEVQTLQAQRSEDRKDQEHLLGLRLKVFEVVNKALEGDERQQRAADALVVSLIHIEDPLREGLRQVLLTQSKQEEKLALVESMAKDAQYRSWLAEAKQSNVSAQEPLPTSNPADALRQMAVDVFFCADANITVQAQRKQRAEQLRQTLTGHAAVRSKVRELAESVNASPGYRVQGLQLRHEASEAAMGQALKERIQAQAQMSFSLRQVANNTPNYLSVFVCD